MRRNILIIIVFVITMNILFFAHCEDVEGLFKEASNLYAKNRYKGAIDEYQKILDQGYESGNVYFNIGDCYFKLGELAKAILYYERAKRLIPRDSDLKKNYEFAFSEIGSQDPVSSQKTLSSWMDKIYGGFNINELTLILSVVYLLILLMIVLGILRKRVTFFASVFTLVFIFYAIFGAIYLKNRLSDIGKEIIVIDKISDIKYGPFDDANTYFQVYEGDKLKIILTQDKWIKVKRSDNKSGWMKNDGIEVI